jgi:hypothetical protein
VYINRQILSEVTSVARRHWSLRRAWTWAGFALAFGLIRSVLWVARKVDDVQWPEIANQKVERPVFIFAIARSGTTLLHRLMSLDEERFASFKLYQSVFCAVSLRRLVDVLERADRRLPGSPLRRCVDGGSTTNLLKSAIVSWTFTRTPFAATSSPAVAAGPCSTRTHSSHRVCARFSSASRTRASST